MLSSRDQRGLETLFNGFVLVLILIIIVLVLMCLGLVSRNLTMQNTHYCLQ